MNLKALYISLLSLLPIAALAQATTKLTASKANDYGIAYSLPNTVFDVVIETEFTLIEPGEFFNYANRYLNATNAVTAPQRSVTVKSVTLVPRGIPNRNNRWLTEFKGVGITYMLLDDADVPIAINTDKVPEEVSVTLPKAVAALPTPLESEAASQAITQEMSSSTSESKRAMLAAQRIYELRQVRNDLISGQAENTPPDGKAMQLALENLSAQEAALNAMFVGTKKTWTDVQTLVFTPGDTDIKDLVIARVSPSKGIIDADDLSGEPIYLSLDVITNGELPTDPTGVTKKAPKDGLAYNIPGTAQITVSYDGSVLHSRDYEIAQLGKTFFLDPKIFTDKKAPAFVIFNPITGGIKVLGTK